MTMTEPRAFLDDFNSIPAPPEEEDHGSWPFDGEAAFNGRPALPELRVVSLEEFVGVTEDVSDPLIGTPDETLLPAEGLLLMYGDGGAGKTTLSVDALAHLAAGDDWLGIPVPAALRVLLIENEGPRGPFRRRLAGKVSDWKGQPFQNNVSVLEEPWTRFTLTDRVYRAGLGVEIDRTETDVVIVGPLASLGAKGTGTPDEINEFSDLVADLRAQAERPYALWIVHHENKAGDVSGAWERYPDTLVHVSAQGNGRTRVHWEKVRWSSELHNTSQILIWADNGAGFTVEEKRDRDLHAEIRDFLLEHPRSTTDVVRSGVEARKQIVTKILKDSLEFGFDLGEHNAHLWSFRPGGNNPEQLFRVEDPLARSGGSLPVGETTGERDGPQAVPGSGTTPADQDDFT